MIYLSDKGPSTLAEGVLSLRDSWQNVTTSAERRCVGMIDA